MVIGLDGRMNDQAGDLEGLTQAEADAAIVAWIKERGQLVEAGELPALGRAPASGATRGSSR